MVRQTAAWAVGLLLSATFAHNAVAAERFEPSRGTQLRADLLEAVRTKAVEVYGTPVEFVVLDLLVANDLAYANLLAQRPGGQSIALTETPAYRNFEWFRSAVQADLGPPNNIQALLRRQGKGWRVIHAPVATTEAWWLEECHIWAPLFPNTCR